MHQGVKKCHVVAHSMGCTVALALAARNPTIVQSVTLFSPVRRAASRLNALGEQALWVAAFQCWSLSKRTSFVDAHDAGFLATSTKLPVCLVFVCSHTLC